MIKRELLLFLLVGLSTVMIDSATYFGLLSLDIMSVAMAKALGFLLGTLFAYYANRFWTFGHTESPPGSAWRFCLVYASTLLANVLVNALALQMLADIFGGPQLAFLIATGVSATLNFLGMKLFVFIKKPAKEFL